MRDPDQLSACHVRCGQLLGMATGRARRFLMLVLFAGVCLLFSPHTVFGAVLEEPELKAFLSTMLLKNTWFSYTSKDGGDQQYHIRSDGSLERCDASFFQTYQFGMGSNTKTLTALLVIQAIEDKRLNLDMKLDELMRLVEAADKKAGRPYPPIDVHPGFARITLKNVLTHHGGFPGVDSTDFEMPLTGGRDALMRKILRHGPVGYQQDFADAPYAFHYSNEGYSMLGEIMERISEPNESFEGLLKKKIFAPLDLKRAKIFSRKEALQRAKKEGLGNLKASELNPMITPSAGAFCTLAEWMKLTKCLMNGVNGAPNSYGLLRRPESFQILRQTQESCFYGAGAVMLSKKPGAAYHFGSNGIHSSLNWFELCNRVGESGTAVVIVSTEPFHDVSSQFYHLAQWIQEKTSANAELKNGIAGPSQLSK